MSRRSIPIAEAEGWDEENDWLGCETLTNNHILRYNWVQQLFCHSITKFFFSYLNQSLTAKESDLQFFTQLQLGISRTLFAAKYIYTTTHEQTTRRRAVICRSRGGLSANEKDEQMHRTAIQVERNFVGDWNSFLVKLSFWLYCSIKT